MLRIFVATICLLYATGTLGRPEAASLFCESQPDSPACAGSAISCTYCHTALAPELNPFGQDLSDVLVDFPSDKETMTDLIESIADQDSDQDGTTNRTEIDRGSLPGSKEKELTVEASSSTYDYDFSFRRLSYGACGESADFEEVETFTNASEDQKSILLEDKLEECLDSEHWLGKDGVVWTIGHYKIRPVGSVKSGEDPGVIEIVDYYNDYHIFVYSQIDDHDARDVLTVDYTVGRTVRNGKTTYNKREPDRVNDGQAMQPERRAGLITSFWTMAFYLNYTAIPRVIVTQVFNGYLGIDLAVMQGLNPVDPEISQFKDYDNKGVTQKECAVCHSTLDPMTYPFRNYNGLTGTGQVLAGQNANGLDNLGTEENLSPLSYSLPRMEYLDTRYPGIIEMPETGYVLGQKVESVQEWAEVVVNSDAFAANTVKDYWLALIGEAPTVSQQKEFKKLWTDFKSVHEFRVEKMLKDLIKTRAFGSRSQ